MLQADLFDGTEFALPGVLAGMENARRQHDKVLLLNKKSCPMEDIATIYVQKIGSMGSQKSTASIMRYKEHAHLLQESKFLKFMMGNGQTPSVAAAWT